MSLTSRSVKGTSPATTANDRRLRRIFYPRFYPLHLFSYLRQCIQTDCCTRSYNHSHLYKNI